MKALLIPALVFMAQATAEEILIAEPVQLSNHTFLSNGQSFAKVEGTDLSPALYVGDQVAELNSHETYTLTGEVVAKLPTYVVAQKIADSLGLSLIYTQEQHAIFKIEDQTMDLSLVLTQVQNLDSVISAQLGMKPDAVETE